MRKFTLLLMSMFLMLGTSMAQDDSEALTLLNMKPANGEVVTVVNYVQMQFNKDVVVTFPEGGIGIKNKETGDVINLTRRNEWTDLNLVIFMFEQKSVVDKEGKEELVEQYISTPGTYSYTIPAGCIKSSEGEEFPEQTFTFSVGTPFSIVEVTPSQGVEKLEKIQLKFNKQIDKVEFPAAGMYLVDNYWVPIVNIKSDVAISDDKMTATLELESPITTPGQYNLDVYNGIFISTDGTKNDYRSLAFNVVDNSASFSTNPKDGDKVKELNNLEITFKNVKEVALVKGADDVVAYLPGGGEAIGSATLGGNKITVSFDQKFTEDGDYTFVIPAGLFTMDGVENEYAEVNVTLYTFTVTPLEIESITPEVGAVDQIEKVVIRFNQNVTLTMDENWQQISREIKLTCGENVYILTYNSTSNLGSELEYLANAEWANNEYVYTPITEKGTYTLDLSQIVVDYAAEDYIDEWGYPNKKWHGKAHSLEGSCAWTIGEGTSIENIEAENGIKVIYDLTGRRVENVTNAGIYIVNGKKVIVK